MDIARIEGAIDKVAAGATEISMSLGGVQFRSMIELMEFAKLMSISDLAVPYHLRGNPGACLAVCTRALRFGFDPFALAEHSYSMKKSTKGDDGKWGDVETIAYDSFVLRAIIQAHAPIVGTLKYEFAGEGDERRCTVTGTPRNGAVPLVHVSPTLGDLKAMRGRNDKGQIRGSPLWDSAKSDQQQAYDTGRDWCRRYHPEILLGWYDKEELEEYGAASAKDITPAKPGIAARLKGSDGKRGFNKDHVDKETGGTKAIENKPEPAMATVATTEKATAQAEPAKKEKPKPSEEEPESDPRADAYEQGIAARDNDPNSYVTPYTDPVLVEAFDDGWSDRDKELMAAGEFAA